MNLLQKRIQQLESEIKDASQKYYEDGSTPLTDAEFDAKVDELRTIDPDNSVVNQTGWGYSVDEDNTPGQKIPHKYGPAGSLDKVRTGEEFKKAFHIGKDTPSYQYTASLKLDGISVVLYYEHGQLVRALTRGDGAIGIDITEKVKVIDQRLAQISARWFTGAVRGEIVMNYHKFERIKEEHPEFKNPRNATAGLINRKDISDDLKFLDILVYSVVGWEKVPNIDIFYNEDDDSMWSFLEEQFMYTAPRESYKCLRSDTLNEQMDELQMRWYGNWPADGIVITKQMNINKMPYISYESVAYKFPSEIKETTVIEVEWNLSKTGYLVPRVKVEPVELAGTTVQYATGFNAQYIKENCIDRGAVVQITKRGEIIPYIVSVIDSAYYCRIPETCPSCGQPLYVDGVHLTCINKDCPNIHHQDLAVWLDTLASVDGLQDTLRTKYLEQILNKTDITIDDVMQLVNSMRTGDALVMLSNTGHEGLIKKMFAELVDKDYRYSISTAIQALNIPRFGDVTCKKFAKDVETAKMIINEFMKPSDLPEGLENTDYMSVDAFQAYNECVTYVGSANTASLFDYRYKLANLKYIWDQIEWEPFQGNEKVYTNVAITGKLSVKRADFEKELEAFGYIANEISKNTVYLITDDPHGSSHKNQKADKWGITKMTEAEFRQKFMRN